MSRGQGLLRDGLVCKFISTWEKDIFNIAMSYFLTVFQEEKGNHIQRQMYISLKKKQHFLVLTDVDLSLHNGIFFIIFITIKFDSKSYSFILETSSLIIFLDKNYISSILKFTYLNFLAKAIWDFYADG